MASTQKPPRRGAWEIGAGDPATVLAEARKALFVMVGFIAVIWIVQLANWADHYQLSQTYGIRPRDVGSLPDIITAPFLHFSWTHIEGNSGPLFIFGFLAAYRGIRASAGRRTWAAWSGGSWAAGCCGIAAPPGAQPGRPRPPPARHRAPRSSRRIRPPKRARPAARAR